MTAVSMATPSQKPLFLPLLKPLFLLLPAFFLVCFLLSLSRTATTTRPSATVLAPQLDVDIDLPAAGSGGDIRIRSGFGSYKEYVAKQLNKTLDPRLRRLWTTRDWERKVSVFASFFRRLRGEGLLHNASRALCVGARTGQEVAALRRVGVADSVGIDLVPAPPLVVAGDFHRQPFPDGSFDFEFSNVFDHALLPSRFVGEIERTLRPGGVCVLHVAVRHRADRYSANDLFSVDALVRLFRDSELVVARKVDGFGLDTEVILRKNKNRAEKNDTPTHSHQGADEQGGGLRRMSR